MNRRRRGARWAHRRAAGPWWLRTLIDILWRAERRKPPVKLATGHSTGGSRRSARRTYSIICKCSTIGPSASAGTNVRAPDQQHRADQQHDEQRRMRRQRAGTRRRIFLAPASRRSPAPAPSARSGRSASRCRAPCCRTAYWRSSRRRRCRCCSPPTRTRTGPRRSRGAWIIQAVLGLAGRRDRAASIPVRARRRRCRPARSAAGSGSPATPSSSRRPRSSCPDIPACGRPSARR